MGLSCLNDQSGPLVCDASAIINLNATGCASELLRAVPNTFIITDVVLDELGEDVRSGRNDARLAAALVADGIFTVASLGELEGSDFELLVMGGSAETLDDGEAATIAFAAAHGMAALIDERKANEMCRLRYPRLVVGSTCDLLALASVEQALGRIALADAVYAALVGARMRVLPQHLEWVINLVGHERAAGCESLPKKRRDALGHRI